MKKTLPVIIAVLIIAGSSVAWKLSKKEAPAPVVTSFEECVKAGNAVMESYPRRCRHGDKTFVEDIGNTIEKADLIRRSQVERSQFAAVEAAKARVNV